MEHALIRCTKKTPSNDAQRLGDQTPRPRAFSDLTNRARGRNTAKVTAAMRVVREGSMPGGMMVPATLLHVSARMFRNPTSDPICSTGSKHSHPHEETAPRALAAHTVVCSL